MNSLVRLDPAAGFATIGEDRVPLEEVARTSHLRVGGESGPVLRAPTFGERSRAAWRALSSADPRDALARGLLRVMTDTDGTADPVSLEIIALALAGADRDGPPFAAAALDVARAAGMDIAALDALDADQVDRLADHLTQAAPSDWQTFVFDEVAHRAMSIRDRLADRLLQRAEPQRRSGDTAPGSAPAGFDDSVARTARGGANETPPGGLAAKPTRHDSAERPPTESQPIGRSDTNATSRSPDPVARILAQHDSNHARPRHAEPADALVRHAWRPQAAAPSIGHVPAKVAPLRVTAAARTGHGGWRMASPGRDVLDSVPTHGTSSSPAVQNGGLAADRGEAVPTMTSIRPSGTATGAASASAWNPTAVPAVAATAASSPRTAAASGAPHVDHDGIADELAQRLDDEAALRGVFR